MYPFTFLKYYFDPGPLCVNNPPFYLLIQARNNRSPHAELYIATCGNMVLSPSLTSETFRAPLSRLVRVLPVYRKRRFCATHVSPIRGIRDNPLESALDDGPEEEMGSTGDLGNGFVI